MRNLKFSEGNYTTVSFKSLLLVLFSEYLYIIAYKTKQFINEVVVSDVQCLLFNHELLNSLCFAPLSYFPFIVLIETYLN